MKKLARKYGRRLVATGLITALYVTMVGFGGFLVGQTAYASQLTLISDTLTESAPSSTSDHTIVFTSTSGVPADGNITIDFDSAGSNFTFGSVEFGDVDITATTPGSLTLAAASSSGTVGVTFSGDTMTIAFPTDVSITAGDVVTVTIGLAATGGNAQITNPSAVASYAIDVTSYDALSAPLDEGRTFVAIVDGVTLNAVVAATFTFTITGTASGETLTDLGGGSGVTTASASSDNYIGFGTLSAGTSVSMAQELNVSTNAANGFTVTVHQNHNMLASSSADIDSFADGTPATDSVWASPTGTIGDEDTYGHLGLHSTANLDAGLTASDSWFGLNGSALSTVWSHDGAADGATPDIGEIDMYYAVEITALQEAGRYQNRLTYIATPTF